MKPSIITGGKRVTTQSKAKKPKHAQFALFHDSSHN